MNNNMTALISCFARCYHSKNSNIKIYNDTFAENILNDEEYNDISSNMKNGINFFNPNYTGNNPLEWIVNNQLAPSVLARSSFNERHLLNEIKLGLEQYVVLASGYDTSGYKVNSKVKVYELDKMEMIKDKKKRIELSQINNDNIHYISCDFNDNWINSLLTTDYDKSKKTFCSLLGISYYLDKKTFSNTIKTLSENISLGSCIIFDYPNDEETENELTNQKLAKGANEEMKSKYSYKDIVQISEESAMLIYEHLNSDNIDKEFFYDYNTLNPENKIIAPKGISYCMLVKK